MYENIIYLKLKLYLNCFEMRILNLYGDMGNEKYENGIGLSQVQFIVGCTQFRNFLNSKY